MSRPDVVVVGLGVQGAATLLELARRGYHVLGLDARRPPHEAGSSHGRTRIIREAYFEHPAYVPLVQQSLASWLELQELTGTVLHRPTGAVHAGPPDCALVQGALASARAHGLEHELLDAAQLRQRFPMMRPEPHWHAVFEHTAGMLLAENCVRTMLELAAGYGAEIRPGTGVQGWDASADVVRLQTRAGVVEAGAAVLAPGAWLNALLAATDAATPLQLPLKVERQTSHWYLAPPTVFAFREGVCPITLVERDDGAVLYTLPDMGHGLKAGLHHGGRELVVNDPLQSLDAPPADADDARLRPLLDEWLPGSAPGDSCSVTCLYTNTPDSHFVIDRHPAHANVIVVSACSGHGFKFAPAVGELAADLVDGEAEPLTLFAADRWSA